MPRGRQKRKKFVEAKPRAEIPTEAEVKEPETASKSKTNGKYKEIDLKPLTINKPLKKPTERQLIDYFKSAFGQSRVHWRKDEFNNINEFKICIKVSKRF